MQRAPADGHAVIGHAGVRVIGCAGVRVLVATITLPAGLKQACPRAQVRKETRRLASRPHVAVGCIHTTSDGNLVSI